MMKNLLIAISCLALAFVFPGCSGGRGGDADMSAAEAASKLAESITFRDALVMVDNDIAENYYRFGDTITDYAVYLSGNGATAEEIAVLKVKEGGDAESARPILEKRVESQKARYEDYVPGEMVKLENPVIVSKGNMIIMVLADDASQAEKAIDGLFK